MVSINFLILQPNNLLQNGFKINIKALNNYVYPELCWIPWLIFYPILNSQHQQAKGGIRSKNKQPKKTQLLYGPKVIQKHTLWHYKLKATIHTQKSISRHFVTDSILNKPKKVKKASKISHGLTPGYLLPSSDINEVIFVTLYY